MNNEAGERKKKIILNKYFVLTLRDAQNDKTQRTFLFMMIIVLILSWFCPFLRKNALINDS